MPGTRTLVLSAALSIASSLSAHAGTITMDIDANKSMYFATVRMNHSIESHYLQDTDGDGKVTVHVPNQETVEEFWVTKPLNDRLVRYKVKSIAAILRDLEPFVTWFFEPVQQPGEDEVSLFIDFTIDEHTDFSTLFSPGDELTATNGSIGVTPLIEFRDASGLPDTADSTLYDPALLPRYSGELRVGSFDSYDPPVVPVPGAARLGLLGVGMASLVMLRRRTT